MREFVLVRLCLHRGPDSNLPALPRSDSPISGQWIVSRDGLFVGAAKHTRPKPSALSRRSTTALHDVTLSNGSAAKEAALRKKTTKKSFLEGVILYWW